MCVCVCVQENLDPRVRPVDVQQELARSRCQRLQTVRKQGAVTAAMVRSAYQRSLEEVVQRQVDTQAAEFERERGARVQALEALRQQALVSLGSGHKLAAAHLEAEAESATTQLSAWHGASATVLARHADAMAEEAAAAGVPPPGRHVLDSKRQYALWCAQRTKDWTDRKRAAAARSRERRRLLSSSTVPRSFDFESATVDDVTVPSFSAVKAAMRASQATTVARDTARAQFLEESRLARQRGQRAVATARRTTDAHLVADELAKLQQRDRVVRGARVAAAGVSEVPPDSRDAARRLGAVEKRLETAFERLLAHKGGGK